VKKDLYISTKYLKGLESLRWDDKQKILNRIGKKVNEVISLPKKSVISATLLSLEYAKNGRTSCIICNQAIKIVGILF